MSKYNLGIVKTSILTNLNETSSVKGFISLLKESDLLKTEFEIFDNIENKHVANEDLAIKYIDENINLLKAKGYTKETFETENSKVLPLIEGVKFATTTKETLYKNIHVLLYESLSGKKATNVNKLHDAFVYVLEYLKTNDKKVVVEAVEVPAIPAHSDDFVLKIAIQEFNQKYSALLSEDEADVLKAVITENKDFKRTTFKTIKENTLNALSTLKLEIDTQNKSKMDVYEQREVDQFTSKIDESIKNIMLLEYKEASFEKDVLDLVNLKAELND